MEQFSLQTASQFDKPGVRIKRKIYKTRNDARAEVFIYIEVFYNRKRRHGYIGNISPVEFEQNTPGLAL
jgi:putative transposase